MQYTITLAKKWYDAYEWHVSESCMTWGRESMTIGDAKSCHRICATKNNAGYVTHLRLRACVGGGHTCAPSRRVCVRVDSRMCPSYRLPPVATSTLGFLVLTLTVRSNYEPRSTQTNYIHAIYGTDFTFWVEKCHIGYNPVLLELSYVT